MVRCPSGRGQAQKDWEAPRTTISHPQRVAKLKALGNAVVPEVAYQVGLWVLDKQKALSSIA
jgi:DNA (cytosine-5)-methyltransferase 1